MPARPFPIQHFLGMDQNAIPGADPRYTRDLDGVQPRFGRLLGMGGTDELRDITTAFTTTPTIGLYPHIAVTLTSKLTRMSPTAFEWLDTSSDVWTDVTGTALTGASTDRPQYDMISTSLIFTNEGNDRPRKWTGSGNTAVLGGTPPFAKALASYVGFVLLGNVSDDGTFTDVTDGAITGRYSDDWDNDWTLCNGNEIILDETPGEILAIKVFGRDSIWFKSDGLVNVRWTGTGIRFIQNRINFAKGIVAPLSAQVTEAGVFFLSTDLELCVTDGQQVKVLPPRVQRKLQETLDVTKALRVVGVVVGNEETYNLFYPTSTADTYNRGRICYNFRTGEFWHRTYSGHQIVRATTWRQNNTTDEFLVAAASDDIVYQLDTTDIDDNGTKVARYYTTDSLNFGAPVEKYYRGMELTFKRAQDVTVKVSVAKDDSDQFLYEQSFSLKGVQGRTDVIVEYRPPQPLKGWNFNTKVRFFHDGTTNKGELINALAWWEPVVEEKRERRDETVDAVM